MTIFTDGLRMAPESAGIDNVRASLGESLSAAAGAAWRSNPLPMISGMAELGEAFNDRDPAKGNLLSAQAGFGDMVQATPEARQDNDLGAAFNLSDFPQLRKPEIAGADAREMVKAAGLDKTLKLDGDDPISVRALDIMMNRARDRREREATMARGPDGFVAGALSVGTSLFVSAVDPVNVAAAFVPVFGELRYAKILATAGESLGQRAAVRAGAGAVEGAVGAAALQPLEWAARSQEGQDFTMAEALHNVFFGAMLGAGLHVGFGGARDIYRATRGRALYPFAPGEPFAGGIHVSGRAISDGGVGAVDLIGEGPRSPLDTLAELPPQAQSDAMRASMASLIEDEPVRAAEMLTAGARQDTRIAEAIEAWHGSPHDFERFDMSRVDTGEGAQSYGHGFYFAENERVARSYRAKLDQSTSTARFYLRRNDGDIGAALAEWDDAVAKSTAQRSAYELQQEAAVRDEIATGGRGGVYKVRILADKEHMLDWDKPLSEQSEYIRNALENHPDQMIAGTASKWGHDVPAMYQRIAQRLGGEREVQTAVGSYPVKFSDDEAVSRALREAGISGIKYLDQGSRDAGDGTRNFVVFDDKLIEITEKNGRPIPLAAARHPASLSAASRDLPPLPQGARDAGFGEHGPEIEGLQDRWSDAVQWLSEAQTGDAHGVLAHPEVPGRIDVIWGTERYGLEHIVQKHPEVLPDLPARLQRMHKVKETSERIQMESADGFERAAIALTMHGDQKVWLLTAFDTRSGGGEKSGPGDPSGLRPAADLRSEPSRYSGEEGAGPTANIGASGRDVTRNDDAIPGAISGRSARGPESDTAWRDLATTPRAEDDPAVIAQSRAAEAMPPPESLADDPSQRVAAAEKADAESVVLYQEAAPNLPEDLRARVDSELHGIEIEAADRAQVIKEGAACLTAAVAGGA